MAFKRQNYEVDPDDENQQNKYREMRLKFARVSPAQFVKYLDTGRETASAGTASSIGYWAVPKDNFPRGLPTKIKPFEVSEAEGPSDVDRDTYFVIDQCVPREQLGPKVFNVTCFSQTASKYQVSGPTRPSLGAGRAATGDDARGDERQDRAATGASVPVVRRSNSRRLRAHASEHASSGPDDDPGMLPSSKAKMVTDTLATLKLNIERAKEANIWISSNNLSNNSVLFWVEQTVGAMEEMVRDAGNGDKNASQRIVNKFLCYLIQMASDTECYPDWCDFKDLLPRLIEVGGPAVNPRTIDDAKLLDNLAKSDPSECHAPVVVDGTSMLCRAHFFNTPCYKSFIIHRVKNSLKAAQAAESDLSRVEMLSVWKDAQGLPKGMEDAVKNALQMFDATAVSLADRIAFMMKQGIGRMAIDWDPRGPIGLAGTLCTEAPNLCTPSLATFVTVCKAIAHGDLFESVQNPIMSHAVALVVDLVDKYDGLVAHALHSRIGVALPSEAPPAIPDREMIENIPKNELKNVAARIKDFFKGFEGPPVWVALVAELWQADVQARSAARAAAKAAEAVVEIADEAATGALGSGDGAPALELSVVPAATGAAIVIFTIGEIVTVKFGSGNNAFNNKKAKVTGVLSHHCWVEFLEGPKQGTAKKIVKTNLTQVEPQGSVQPPSCTASDEGDGDDAPRVGGAATAATGAPSADDTAWNAAEDVF